jgi:murein DD-endopeptidase MepM/ murein hydrolase activator NlpD
VTLRGIITILFIICFLNFGSIGAKGEENSSVDINLSDEIVETSNYRGDILEVRDVISDQRDIDSDVRDVFIEKREVFNVYEDKNKDLNFINPLKKLAVTSNWGGRVDPINGEINSDHNGIDLAASLGTRVYSPESGVVRTVGWLKGYGKSIIIDHGSGYSTRYAHLSKYKVKVGDTVVQGDFIARTGNTGRSTGPHLHYEVRYEEKPLDPVEFLQF